MKIIILTLAINTLLLGCYQKPVNQDFLNFVSSAEEVKLPIIYSCETIPLSKHQLVNDTFLEKYVNPNSYFIGRMFKSKGFITLLFGQVADNNFSVAYTFSVNGNPIDTLEMSGVCFTGPEGTEQTYSSRIELNGNFIVTDTLKSSKLDENGNDILGTETISVITKKYKLGDSGKFTHVESMKKKLR